jgi:fructan beta-fructosidase
MNRLGLTLLISKLRMLSVRGSIIGLACVSALGQSTQPKAVAYDEPYRPQVHFSPQHHWTNDPNGLVYFKGEYHLFYQYNPLGDTWGHMSWGHAVSPDLLHWQVLPVAIPESDTEMIYTGSVVVDERNTSGLCRDGNACLVAIYTGHRGHGDTQREVQDIAASQDRGRTWQVFSGNPVLDLGMSNFRDPSVTWNDEAHAWLMAVSLPNEHQVAFYTSSDLKQWTRRSTFGPAGATGGQWECPDLLRVPGEKGSKEVWALKVGLNPGSLQGGSGEQFFLGNFDGTQFTQSTEPGSHGWTDYGKDSYCAISYNHLPAGEKPTLIGWMNNWQYANKLPTSPWRGQMTLARRLTAIHDQAGLALSEDPVIAPLRMLPARQVSQTLSASKSATELINAESPAELKLSFRPGDTQNLGLRVYSDDEHWTEIGFDNANGKLYVDRTHSGLTVAKDFPARTEAPLVKSRPWNLHLILDRSSVSVFAQNGTLAMTNLIFPPGTKCQVMFFRQGGTQAVSVKGTFWNLRSIWTGAATANAALQEGR